nr:rhomboid family intramembrane serine protease [Bacteroidota bacterium]
MSYNSYQPFNANQMPPAVKVILFTNIGLWLVSYLLYTKANFDLSNHLALFNWGSVNFRPWQFITYGFMHSFLNNSGSIDFWHIMGNMFGLYFFGSHLERFWGTRRFVIFYFVCLLGAVIIYWGYNMYSQSAMVSETKMTIDNITPFDFYNYISKHEEVKESIGKENLDKFYSAWKQHPNDTSFENEAKGYLNNILDSLTNGSRIVGASGAVFGILLAFAMLFPNTLITPLIGFPIKAKYFVLLYGIVEFYSVIANVPGDSVAHIAHLGGMLTAFVLVKLWHR